MTYYIYAVWDNMLRYFQPPFIADDVQKVLAALATTVNSKDATHAFSQAPAQFELWSLGTITYGEEITKENRVEENKAIVCTLDSLIRGSVRAEPERSTKEVHRAAQPSHGNLKSP